MRKLSIQNTGTSPVVIKDYEGYSTFVMEIPPGETRLSNPITYDVIERLQEQLDAVSTLVWEVQDYPAPIAVSYDNTTRPDPTTVDVGTMIFNTDDGAPNWSNGTVWVDASGTPT